MSYIPFLRRAEHDTAERLAPAGISTSPDTRPSEGGRASKRKARRNQDERDDARDLIDAALAHGRRATREATNLDERG
jgi:hypothetical protein